MPALTAPAFNYVAIGIAALAFFVLGVVWYGLLAKPWMRLARVSEEHVRQEAGGYTYATAAASSLVCAAALAWLIGISEATTLFDYLTIAFVCAAGVLVAGSAKHYAFLSHPPGLLAIDGGYDVTGFLAMSLILWYFR